MLLTDIVLDEEHLGHRRALLGLKSGITVLVAKNVFDGLYDIFVYGNFGAAARAADPVAKKPSSISTWSKLDALTAQCVLFEITDNDPVNL